MQGAVIKKGTKIYKSIIAQDAVVGEIVRLVSVSMQTASIIRRFTAVIL